MPNNKPRFHQYSHTLLWNHLKILTHLIASTTSEKKFSSRKVPAIPTRLSLENIPFFPDTRKSQICQKNSVPKPANIISKSGRDAKNSFENFWEIFQNTNFLENSAMPLPGFLVENYYCVQRVIQSQLRSQLTVTIDDLEDLEGFCWWLRYC